MASVAEKRRDLPRRCTPRAASSCRIRSTSAAPATCSSSASRRWRRRAPGSPGRLRLSRRRMLARGDARPYRAHRRGDRRAGQCRLRNPASPTTRQEVAESVTPLRRDRRRRPLDRGPDAATRRSRSTSSPRRSSGSRRRARRSMPPAATSSWSARAECFLVGHPDPLKEAIRRLEAFAEAGADCLYAPGPRRRDDIAAIVKAVAPKPVNVLVGGPIGLTRRRSRRARRAAGQRRRRACRASAWGGFMRMAARDRREGPLRRLRPGGRASPSSTVSSGKRGLMTGQGCRASGRVDRRHDAGGAARDR